MNEPCNATNCPNHRNADSPWCDKHLDEALAAILRAAYQARTGKPYTGKILGGVLA